MCSDWLGDNHDSTCNLVKISEWEMRGIWKRAVCRCDVSTLVGEEMKLRLGDLLLRHWPCSGRWGPAIDLRALSWMSASAIRYKKVTCRGQ
jgi:hypothetical protein